MAELPRDPVERQKLTLIVELHQSLLNYRNAQRGWASADASQDVTINDALKTHYPDIPHQAATGKTNIEIVLESWIEPRVKLALEKLDPRKVKTPSQAHQLQGVLAYYFTYVREYLSAGQIVDSKLNDAQTICDTWCQITGAKRFVVNKTIESLLIVKSSRTVQRYVPQGMAIVFSISFGVVRADKKAKQGSEESTKTDPARTQPVEIASIVTPAGDKTLKVVPASILANVSPTAIEPAELDHLIAAIRDLRKTASNPSNFNALVEFAVQVSESIYSKSRYFGQFIRDLMQVDMDSIEHRIDTTEARERLRNHPAIKKAMETERQLHLQANRQRDIETVKRLCHELTIENSAGRDRQDTITKLQAAVVDRLDDAVFTTLIANTFDRLSDAYQVALIAKFLESCGRPEFGFAVSLAARPTGAFVRSKVQYLARTARGCGDHIAVARNLLAQLTEHVNGSTIVSSSAQYEVSFLHDYISAFVKP